MPAPPADADTKDTGVRRRMPRSRVTVVGALAASLLVFLAALVIYPIIKAVISVVDGSAAAPGQSALSGLSSDLGSVLLNTLVVVGGGSLIAVIVGTGLAWINERTDGGFGGLGQFMPIAPLLLPGITGVLGWVVLLDPRIGLLNSMTRSVLGTVGISVPGDEGPINIFSMTGLVLLTALHLVPFVYLIVAPTLKNLDPSIEEAARINGAGPLRTALRVTLPAIAPSIGAAWTLAIINGIGLFSVPVVIGTTARIDVVSVRVWRLLTNYPTSTASAMVLAGGMLLVVLAFRFAQSYFFPAGRQATIGGRGARAGRIRLGPWRILTKLVVIVYILSAVVLPVAGLLIVSFQRFWTATAPWKNLTLSHYEDVLLYNPVTYQALIHSVALAALVGTIAMAVCAFLMLYAHQHRGGAGRRTGGKKIHHRFSSRKGLIDLVTSLPATIPPSLIGVSFILAFSRPPLNLYGTFAILLLAFLVMQLPYAASAAGTATSVVGNDLAEAARIFGASDRRTMTKILLPLALPGLAAGWVLVFIHVLGEVTAASLLSSTSNPVVGSVLLDLYTQGDFSTMATFAIVVWAISSVLVFASLLVSNRRFAESKG
ncbi:ABC transporter permease [Rhodococcus wratislaviensis]|nr:ABC transporter permease subunit [Rhodococcus wratislaviensis]